MKTPEEVANRPVRSCACLEGNDGFCPIHGSITREPDELLHDAKMMEEAGAIALLLEAVPSQLAGLIAASTTLPVIGCVSGAECDGQVVVLHDILGLGAGHPPRSVRVYAEVSATMRGAFASYLADVQNGTFPIPEQSARMSEEERSKLQAAVLKK